ncbi:PREDICTED: protein ecdysoneless homolog [Nelumbo nucifera]|uniref:Protein ecdysoneless homolog n=1 Tax=Nelumbo nucifera TaxID=4432 RepID=A0A1U7ZDP9_NELNU|nr:PREDICTED: protein ecdysoneless homolog [Nelumbo nucifera]
MDEVVEAEPSPFSQTSSSRTPEDSVFYAIFPDFSIHSSKTLKPTATSNAYDCLNQLSSSFPSLHVQVLDAVSPYLSDYIWQHEAFNLSLSSIPKPNCLCSSQIPHLHGKVRYGDNLEDEWFVVFLLFEITRRFPSVSVRVWDTDGEFLLIEAAYSLPRWIKPENSSNRVFIRQGELHIVPKERFPSNPSLYDSLRFLATAGVESRASDSVQSVLRKRISGYPERARANMHQVRVRVPVSVAQVLKHEPCLISLAVEGFYDRDIDTMKYAARMEKFLSGGSGEELVQISVRMSRAMYGQLVQQTFQAPKWYPMPPRTDASAYMEAELGMKIACGFEMMYQQRRRNGLEGKGSTWDVFLKSLESSGYFAGLLPGSKEYRRLMESAQEYYRNSSAFSRTSEMMNAPVKRIGEILALPHSADDFKGVSLPPSDDDSWLYSGEDDLNSAILERQKEMEFYELNRKKKNKSSDQQEAGYSSSMQLDDFDLGDITRNMKAFVNKVSSYEGAEVPENSNLKAVDLNVERFIKDMELAIRCASSEQMNIEEGSSSDMDFDDSEDESDIENPPEDNGGREDAFMSSYSAALNDELKSTTLKKSFIRTNEQSSKNIEGTSNSMEDMDEEFSPIDVDVNLVKSVLDSFSSQQGLPGPASSLLGLMGLQLPQETRKDK